MSQFPQFSKPYRSIVDKLRARAGSRALWNTEFKDGISGGVNGLTPWIRVISAVKSQSGGTEKGLILQSNYPEDGFNIRYGGTKDQPSGVVGFTLDLKPIPIYGSGKNIRDWIYVEDVIEGTVESIGFRSTVVRRFDKSLATIPNFQFAEKAVINNSLITNRRINWIIGLEYRTTSKQLIDIKQQIENYIKNSELFSKSENTMLSVKIDQFAASSIDIKLICFTKTTKYLEWMQVKDLLALEIKNIVEKNNASFAFPSTSVYVEKN